MIWHPVLTLCSNNLTGVRKSQTIKDERGEGVGEWVRKLHDSTTDRWPPSQLISTDSQIISTDFQLIATVSTDSQRLILTHINWFPTDTRLKETELPRRSALGFNLFSLQPLWTRVS